MSQQWIRYTIDLTPDAWAALLRHGYRPELPPRGVGGGPEVIESGVYGLTSDGQPVRIMLRNRVCELDGVEVDGHEGSELDPPCSTACLHCPYEGPNP